MKKVLFFLMMFVSIMASAQKGTEINLWPEGPHTSNGDAEDMAKVTIFLPDEKKATGRAIVCCPGGGYTHLAMQHEGFDWAPFFNEQGMAHQSQRRRYHGLLGWWSSGLYRCHPCHQ